MKKYFTYEKSADSEVNDIVDCTLELARARASGAVPADYEAKKNELNKSFGKKIAEGTIYADKFETEGLAMFNSKTVRNNTNIRDNFNAILTQVCTVIVPEVTNDNFAKLIADVHQVGFGDTARFTIESNDLFKVNKKAEGVRKGVDQAMYDDEITVNASPLTIDTHIDWYPFASGIFDFGAWALKVGRSFMAYVFIKCVRSMTSATTQFGAAYEINGVTPQLFGKLRERVIAANGGMPVVAVGTAVALSNLSLTGNYQVEIGEEMNKIGFLDQYLGVPVIGIHNVLVPGTTNGAATLVLPDDKIFLIPAAGQRPVKVVFEGNEVSVTYNPDESSDRRYGLSVEMRLGVAVVCSAKYGTISL